MVEPVDPVQGDKLDGVDAAPGLAVDHLGLEQSVDGLGQRVVVGIPDAADGGLDASVGQAVGVANAHVLLGLNWSSQHKPDLIVAARRELLQVSSTPASYAVCY